MKLYKGDKEQTSPNNSYKFSLLNPIDIKMRTDVTIKPSSFINVVFLDCTYIEMMKSLRFYFLVSIVFLVGQKEAFATHLRAGNITVRRLSPNSREYEITLHVYTRCESTVKFSDQGGNPNQ